MKRQSFFFLQNKEEDEQILREIGVNPMADLWSGAYWISGTDQQQEGKWVDSVTGTYKN